MPSRQSRMYTIINRNYLFSDFVCVWIWVFVSILIIFHKIYDAVKNVCDMQSQNHTHKKRERHTKISGCLSKHWQLLRHNIVMLLIIIIIIYIIYACICYMFCRGPHCRQSHFMTFLFESVLLLLLVLHGHIHTIHCNAFALSQNDLCIS